MGETAPESLSNMNSVQSAWTLLSCRHNLQVRGLCSEKCSSLTVKSQWQTSSPVPFPTTKITLHASMEFIGEISAWNMHEINNSPKLKLTTAFWTLAQLERTVQLIAEQCETNLVWNFKPSLPNKLRCGCVLPRHCDGNSAARAQSFQAVQGKKRDNGPDLIASNFYTHPQIAVTKQTSNKCRFKQFQDASSLSLAVI